MFSRKNIRIHMLSAGILLLGFSLCRYGFFHLHQMKQWPVLLLILGAMILAMSFVRRATIVPLVSSAAYPIAFAVAVLFQTDTLDPLRGRINNMWILWTLVFLGITLFSVLAEILFVKKRHG